MASKFVFFLCVLVMGVVGDGEDGSGRKWRTIGYINAEPALEVGESLENLMSRQIRQDSEGVAGKESISAIGGVAGNGEPAQPSQTKAEVKVEAEAAKAPEQPAPKQIETEGKVEGISRETPKNNEMNADAAAAAAKLGADAILVPSADELPSKPEVAPSNSNGNVELAAPGAETLSKENNLKKNLKEGEAVLELTRGDKDQAAIYFEKREDPQGTTQGKEARDGNVIKPEVVTEGGSKTTAKTEVQDGSQGKTEVAATQKATTDKSRRPVKAGGDDDEEDDGSLNKRAMARPEGAGTAQQPTVNQEVGTNNQEAAVNREGTSEMGTSTTLAAALNQEKTSSDSTPLENLQDALKEFVKSEGKVVGQLPTVPQESATVTEGTDTKMVLLVIRGPDDAEPERPINTCPSLQDFIEGSHHFWTGLKEATGWRDGVGVANEVLHTAVASLEQCIKKIGTDIGNFFKNSNAKASTTNSNSSLQKRQLDQTKQQGSESIEGIKI